MHLIGISRRQCYRRSGSSWAISASRREIKGTCVETGHAPSLLDGHAPSLLKLLDGRGDVLVDDEPLALLFLEHCGPAEGAHVTLAVLTCHIRGHGGCYPLDLPGVVDLGIIVDDKLGGFVIPELFRDSGLVLLPTVVFQGRDIEKDMWALGV